MKYYPILFFAGFCFLMMTTGCTDTKKKQSGIPDEEKKQALKKLHEVLAGQSEWVKVHAAEFLIWSGNPEGVQKAFVEEEKKFGTQSPYRIGIWRVLAQTAENAEEKKVWTDKVMRAFLDTTGKDRIHAAETLAKLKISPLAINPEITKLSLKDPNRSLALYTAWSVAFSSADSTEQAKKNFLEILFSGNEDAASQKQAAYVIRQFGELPVAEWERLAGKELSAAEGPEANAYRCSAVFVTAPYVAQNSEQFEKIHQRLLKLAASKSKGDRSELAMALSIRGTAQDAALLRSMLNNENPLATDADNADVQAAAGYALLAMEQRQAKPAAEK